MSPSRSKERKAVFLFGPTAVGKTRLLFDFFSEGCEVVNADSVQVYRHLDIGSAKADGSVLERVPHHLIDILDPWETYNVADFIRLADAACEDIWARGRIPVISGGTAFYFKHFMFGLSEAPQSDPETRRTVELFIRDQGLQKAHDYLRIVDPVSAERINPNDSYRISRAIEVYRVSGKPLSSFALPTTPRNDMTILSIGLTRGRDELKGRIRMRVDQMFDQGLVAEIRSLLSMGANPEWQSMQGIGYREFMNHVYTGDAESSIRRLDAMDGDELSVIRDEITMNSVHYAKRQMTFFRSFADVHWIEPDDIGGMESLLKGFLDIPLQKHST
ncbi:MAG: tRNA (adenosine(37)-N6)-dimethylallyltransferase MiaA [Spirochaetales bacterium]|nr:tRNA (adenosine(37)-N6)-dimethylallyltransferase MiaA [Spirochaetales bacterium]